MEAVRQPSSRQRDVRDNPVWCEGTGSTVTDKTGQGDPNSLTQDLSQSVQGKVNFDEIPFADETDDSDDPDLSTADSSRSLYHPPRPRNPDDVDVCTIPCYPHCLVMFSSASGRYAFSNDYKGGWLPYSMHNVLRKMAQRHFRIDLLEALTEVNEAMTESLETHTPSDKVLHQTKSTACIYHMLTKDIYFKPKYALVDVPLVDDVQVTAV
ncbi:uncharacterized protein LOC117322837 [Pecten maximus]|uniref:uncharacterized protein LOC117322837 n=1 Tax=Pecten maximus TaxID=6579 RepID=UPI00145843D8|nr:uncharacterized protein LOC117322837 [Pecten maximus]